VNAHARPDGDLPAAKRRLDYAVIELTRPRSDGYGHFSNCLYLMLADALGGEQGTGYNGMAMSQPPIFVDAADLLLEIDTAVECWSPQLSGVPVTIGRLRALQARSWKPQETRSVHQIAEACEIWAKQISALLNPEAVKHFRSPDGEGFAACPWCEKATTYRKDPSDGESKRVPTLQWTKDTGTVCIACREHRPPAETAFVARLLGFDVDDVFIVEPSS
jgi:hypothetical protein